MLQKTSVMPSNENSKINSTKTNSLIKSRFYGFKSTILLFLSRLSISIREFMFEIGI